MNMPLYTDWVNMTLINKTKYLEFKCAKAPLGNDWHYVKRTNDSSGRDSAVVITTLVRVDNEYNFLFLKTKRPPIYSENKAEFCIESPAGLIGDENCEESTLDCARKELLEETGLTINKLYLELINSSTSAGLSSETLTYITAFVENDTVSKQPVDDGGIITDRFYVKARDIFEYLNDIDKTKYSICAPTICGVFYALKRLELLTL